MNIFNVSKIRIKSNGYMIKICVIKSKVVITSENQ